MKRRDYLLLFLVAFGLALGLSLFFPTPGYMDAEYYFALGLRLAQGHGFSEPFLWNYLDNPAGLPHPSHAYWMPLASLLSALGLWLSGSAAFTAGRLPFLLAAGCIPPLTAALAHSFTSRRDLALLSGLLALFPGYYLAFLVTTDTFGLYMLLGGVFFLLAGPGVQAGGGRFLLLGAAAGLMHLARADGLLWLGLAFMGALLAFWGRGTPGERPRRYLALAGLALVGYLLVMGPWLVRNLFVFGSPLAPGGSKALWLRAYDELYTYPASLLTPQRWLASGWGEILGVRLRASGTNLLHTLAVQGQVFLLPLAAAGLWRLRSDRRVFLGTAGWLLTFAAMSLVFPFQGARGGYFHSGAALQPLIWAAAPAGLEAFIAWGVRRRGWAASSAGPVFRTGLVALAALMTVFLAAGRAVEARTEGAKNGGGTDYAALERLLQAAGAGEEDIILVNNTPGFYLTTGRPAISIPDGGPETLLAAGWRYGARFVLLEVNHPVGLNELYTAPGDREGLVYLGAAGGAYVFEIQGGAE